MFSKGLWGVEWLRFYVFGTSLFCFRTALMWLNWEIPSHECFVLQRMGDIHCLNLTDAQVYLAPFSALCWVHSCAQNSRGIRNLKSFLKAEIGDEFLPTIRSFSPFEISIVRQVLAFPSRAVMSVPAFMLMPYVFFVCASLNSIESTYVSERVLFQCQVSLAFNPVIYGIYGILRVV